MESEKIEKRDEWNRLGREEGENGTVLVEE